MASQVKLDVNTTGIVLKGNPVIKTGTIAKNAGRTTDLEQYTVLAYVVADDEWVPLTDVEAIDGSHCPRGILVSPTIAAASIVADDVDNVEILVGGSNIQIDEDLLVLENSLELTDTISRVEYNELATQFTALVSAINGLVTIFNAHVHGGITAGASNSAVSTTTQTALSGIDLDDAEQVETLEDALRSLNIYCKTVVETAGYEND